MFDDSWRDFCEDGSDYDIDPEDYDTEEEYMEALEEAKEEYTEKHNFDDYRIVGIYIESDDEDDEDWRDDCEDGSDYDIDPYDFDTEEEYIQALDAAKAERNIEPPLSVFIEKLFEGINIDPYPAKSNSNNWRYNCTEDNEFGLDPEDYDTEEEYEDALQDEIEYYDDNDDNDDDYDGEDDYDDYDDDYDDDDDDDDDYDDMDDCDDDWYDDD